MKIRIKGLEFSYDSIQALKNVTIDIYESEIVAIVGPNGSGKSTLLKCIDRILKPQKGVILINGKDVKNFSQIEIARTVGYVPQSVKQFFPATVFEVVLMGRRPYLGWRCSRRDIEKVFEVLRILDIENIAMRDFNELSGGQQQKVLIARALAQEPEILLLDEPTANLDIKHQLEVMEIIRNIVRENGITAVVAIHDLNLASRYADRIVMMKDGKVFAVGDPNDVLTPTNIEKVYGVKVKVIKLDGRLCVIPLDPLH
ncbi:ABC transporter ATP-binding protein [Archaeoglobus profundus]|uniref:ABC transporter related protein n=1 Tax=Archaeoglobus profundus (strain DSM 5631 / JCM 9629 / NBRC 100127 / Av18) TaxID=572546 RepID=D2RDC8_ARCPA|nr:ABC transporter ATP-binding protein [Archaeoglobus profundus]ADB58122.1 ABC transporter related protein [Archaeoglobus profundus DSM 5631]